MTFDPNAAFDARVARLPRLGVGVSTEFGAAATGLDLFALAARSEGRVRFLEVGCDLERGADDDARRWAAEGRPLTYHFLDANLEEGEDLDDPWVRDTASLARELGAAWLCGDAGLWHVGPRERGHGVLMPPVLEPDGARAMAENVRSLRERAGFEVLPENPPAHVYVGRLHLLDYFARVAEGADSGLLLDVAHLAIYQRVLGHGPLTGLDGFPLERVVEVHVAGGRPFRVGRAGTRELVEDDHGVDVLPDAWEILGAVLPRASNLRAIVFECERNGIDAVLPVFERLDRLWNGRPAA